MNDERQIGPLQTPDETGRLTEYDHAEIIAAYRAGVTVDQLAHEYRRTVGWIRVVLRRGQQSEQTKDQQ